MWWSFKQPTEASLQPIFGLSWKRCKMYPGQGKVGDMLGSYIQIILVFVSTLVQEAHPCLHEVYTFHDARRPLPSRPCKSHTGEGGSMSLL